MPLMLLVIYLHELLPWSSLLDFLAGISGEMHKYCLNVLPKNSAYWELKAALLCSKSIYSTPFIKPIKALGLLHLFVVSGFHLQLIYQLLERRIFRSLKSKQICLLSLLFLYTLFCNLKAPVLRAYLQIIFSLRNPHHSLKTLLGGCLILAIAPQMWSSLSLQLSWCVALVISSKLIHKTLSLLLIYILLFLFLSPLEVAHPISILTTLVFTPLIAFVFLPLSFISALIPALTPLSDPLWRGFIGFLKILSSELPLLQPNFQLLPWHKWFLLITFNLVLFYLEVRHKRRPLCP